LAAGARLPSAHAAGADTIKVGLIGCGGRGTGAAGNCIDSSPGVQLYAMGDLVKDRLDRSRTTLSAKYKKAEQMDVPDGRCFVGWDAYKQVIGCGVDVVLLTTPPGFRPMQLAEAVRQGKHVFMEKPVAVDPVGVRSVIASSDLAARKKLAIVAGTQLRHHPPCLAVIKRLGEGAIGRITGGQCWFNTGFLWVRRRQEGWSDMEWQCRNWLYFTWLSGDHIVEQCVHYIDLLNWGFGGPPVKALGVGGREVRRGEEHGNIFDHFAVEYTYPGGAKAMCMCRQIRGTSQRTGTRLVGAKGVCSVREGTIEDHKGAETFKYAEKTINPQVQEHADLIAGIRKGEPLNEGRRIAESSMTAIIGRMSAYTGREVSWKWAMESSRLDLMPRKFRFGPLPVRPVAVPGKTKLI